MVSQFLRSIFVVVALLSSSLAVAASVFDQGSLPAQVTASQPALTPTAPTINANGYVLMDANSGVILAAKNPEQRMPPASLTKMMTSYIVSAALKAGRIHLDDTVLVSKDAWKTGGSKMFIKVGNRVAVRDLMQGIIVDSGNDACVAMAEHIAGSQEAFVSLMNQQAALLGMKNTHFTDANGLPDPQHYTTPTDMAILGRALIFDYPEDYKWYSQKWFTYNGIKQPNRNRLLWRDPSVDGIKTGHTDNAGFCLVSSALRNGTRLIAVVMGAPTDAARADNSQKLLTYGFRFFEGHKLFDKDTALKQARVWFGAEQQIPVGLSQPLYVSIPAGQSANIKTAIAVNNPVAAPIKKGQAVGTVTVTLSGKTVTEAPLVALQDNPEGGFFRRMSDHIRLLLSHARS